MGKRNWKNKQFKNKQRRNFNNRSKNQQQNRKSNDESRGNFQRKTSDRMKYSKESIIKNDLKESDVGIDEYTSKLDGFSGIIKARFSDFHVNEIDLIGREVKLTNQEIPKIEKDELDSAKLEKIKDDLKGIVTSEMWNNIDKMLKGDDDPKSVEIDVSNIDKEKRTIIHKTLKEQYGGRITSSTVDCNEKKLIKVIKSNGKGEKRSRWIWPGEYTYFVCHKENVSTIQAASDLAQQLKMPASSVNYAGTKDKRAKTSQLFCIKKREPLQIINAAKRYPYIKIGNFEFHNKVLKLGELKGNRFRLVLRHINEDEEKIVKNLENLQSNGFINYYGLQRFGNSAEIPTYKIGIQLLKSNFKEACELILKPREGDHPVLKEAREVWWKNRNSAEASSILNKKSIEKMLLDGLAMYGENDYATSLKKIPRNMLLMYTHSYQSFIWNRIASRRIREFGLKLMPGDLIYKDEKELCGPCDIMDLIEETEDCENIPNDDISDETMSHFKTKVRPLTEDDISSQKYTIFDVVLPLPGCDITYPSNVVNEWYIELLAEENLSSDKLRNKTKTYSLLGSYRKLMIKPKNLKWEFKIYNSPESTLIASDYEELKQIKADNDIPGGKFKALLLDFILPESTYATMALRELLKSDTSSSNQRKLMEEEKQKNKSECDGGIDNDDGNDDSSNSNNKNENDDGLTASEKRKAVENNDDNCNETINETNNKKLKLDES